jgi:hypothetical protein
MQGAGCAGESSSQRRVSPLSRQSDVRRNFVLHKPGGTAEKTFVPVLWMMVFVFLTNKKEADVKKLIGIIKSALRDARSLFGRLLEAQPALQPVPVYSRRATRRR